MKMKFKPMNILKTIQLIALALTCSLAATLKAQNVLYVANYANNTIGEYTDSGSSVNASLITGLDGPVGLAISGNDLFVANSKPSHKPESLTDFSWFPKEYRS